jgi:hypothetical protein
LIGGSSLTMGTFPKDDAGKTEEIQEIAETGLTEEAV